MASCQFPTQSQSAKDASGDSLYGPRVCADPAFVNWALDAHDFDKDYWDDGFGWGQPCNTDLPLARTLNALWALNYSAENYNRDTYEKSDIVPIRSVVSGVSRHSSDVSLYVVGFDGGIYGTWWDGKWHDWGRIGTSSNNVPTNSVVTSLSRNSDHVDLFVVGHNGGIYSNWWHNGLNNGLWAGWFQIGGAGNTVPIRSTVSAVSRDPNDVSIYVVGHDGCIYTSWWHLGFNNNQWATWARIGEPSNNVPTTSTVTAFSRNPDRVDLFVVGHNGGIYWTWWNAGQNSDQWAPWSRIGNPADTVPIRSVVTATSRGANDLSIYVVGHNGGIYTNYWDAGNNRWTAWSQIGGAGNTVPTNSEVTAISRNPNHVDLYVVGHNGGIYSTWWHAGQNNNQWAQWFQIGGSTNTVPTRSVVGAVSRNANDVGLYVVGHDGGIWTSWWLGGSNSNQYAGWSAITGHNILHWGRRYVKDQIDELLSKCAGRLPSTVAHTEWGVRQFTELFLPFFYQRTVPERAGTLVHEARHASAKSHNAKSPGSSVDDIDSSWGYQGAWMYHVLYLWWFYLDAQRTNPALQESARVRANTILATGFATDPGFRIAPIR